MNDRINIVKNGGWVFLSHSHQDVALVRKIRNEFEKLGFEPLMFYLKCLSDKDEIEELIKREIDSRDWFVYLDSPNARNSNWVKTERKYIEQFNDKKIFTIDLNSDISTQLDLVRNITNQLKVYISFHNQDRELYEKIKVKLLEKDMLVLSDDNINLCSDLFKSVDESIINACHSGFVIVLITEQTCKSQYVLYEINKTIANNGKIVPLYVGESTISKEWLPLLSDIQGVHVSKFPTDYELNNLIDSILKCIK